MMKLNKIFVLCAIFTAVCPASHAQTQSHAQNLLHQFWIASGGDAWSRLAQAQIDGTITVGGAAGTFQQIVDLKNGRDVTTFQIGPLQGRQGNLENESWEMDRSGLVTVHDGAEAKADAIDQSFQDRNGWFHAPASEIAFSGTREDNGVAYDLITITPAGGRQMTLWLDAREHLLRRLAQESSGHQQSTTYFSDYRKINGVLYPFVSRESNGNSSQDSLQVITTIRFSATSDPSLFKTPPSVFHDAKLLAGGSSVNIPFELADGRILMQLSIDGHAPMPFLLDTGAQNYLTPEAAKNLGVDGSGNAAAQGVGPKVGNVQFAEIKEMRAGPLQMLNQQFLIGPLPAFLQDRGKKPPIAGLVGYELLRRFVVTINYQKKLLTFYRPGVFPDPPAGAQALPIQFNSHNPLLQVSVDGVPGYFGIDTGDSSYATLFGHFYDAHQFAVEQPAQKKQQGGIGGMGSAWLTRIETLAFGDWTLHRPVINLNFARSGVFSSDFIGGNLGHQVLQNFVFTLDYEHRRIFLQKSSTFDRPVSYNRSGISLKREQSGAVVVAMADPGTPGAEAGLEPGDTVLSINGQAPNAQGLPDFEKVLSFPAGTRLSVRYARAGKERQVSFQLRELLPMKGDFRAFSSQGVGQ